MKRSALKSNPEKTRAWRERTRRPLPVHKKLESRSTLVARKAIRKVGKVGRANIQARQAIAVTAEAMKLKTCELGPVLARMGYETGCTKTWPLAPAHRHKRAWYKGDAEKLADVRQWVAACTNCHDCIEHNAELTSAVFYEIRGPESA